MTTTPPAHHTAELAWVKSSYSSNEGPNCVEVATAAPTVHVRDSKNHHGPQLAFQDSQWTDFLTYTSRTDRG